MVMRILMYGLALFLAALLFLFFVSLANPHWSVKGGKCV